MSRLLFANFTSSLLIVNSTLLAYAALALAALGGQDNSGYRKHSYFRLMYNISIFPALAYLFYYLTTVRMK